MRKRDILSRLREGTRDDQRCSRRSHGDNVVLLGNRRLALLLSSLLVAVLLIAVAKVAAQTDTAELTDPIASLSSMAPPQEIISSSQNGVLPTTKNPDLNFLQIQASMVPEDGEAGSFDPVRLQITITNTGSMPLGGLTVKIEPDPSLVFIGDVRGFDFAYEQNPIRAMWKNVSIQPNQVVILSYLTNVGEIAPGTSPELTSKFEVSGDGVEPIVQSVSLKVTPPDVTPSQNSQDQVEG